ncbi:hypothetical protein GCM10009113_17040 [Marinobacter szutsaonensis]
MTAFVVCHGSLQIFRNDRFRISDSAVNLKIPTGNNMQSRMTCIKGPRAASSYNLRQIIPVTEAYHAIANTVPAVADHRSALPAI